MFDLSEEDLLPDVEEEAETLRDVLTNDVAKVSAASLVTVLGGAELPGKASAADDTLMRLMRTDWDELSFAASEDS